MFLVNERAFGQASEARLVDALRAGGGVTLSLVASLDGVVGFGFERASRFGLRWEAPCPDEAFLALELRPGALGRRPGVVRYRPEFAAV